MNLAFISYWSLEDPLCVATVLPHVRILAEHPDINSVHLLTFERGKSPIVDLGPKIQHYVVKQPPLLGGLGFLLSYLGGLKVLLQIHFAERMELIVCRSIFAGFLGHVMFKLLGIPYTVESYEPHAQYMVENGVWSSGSWKEKMILWWDRLVKSSAFMLYPVSEGYARVLLDEGVPKRRVEALPCTVDLEQFRFSQDARQQLRTNLSIPADATVCIYVGKFGGMYLKEDARPLLESVFAEIPNLYLILLTNPESTTVNNLLSSPRLVGQIRAQMVDPQAVSSHLSAADFALVLTRPTKTSSYLSPIKIGEYLLNGLPIIIPPGIGDDSQHVKDHNLGIVLRDLENLSKNEARSLSALIEERKSGSSRIEKLGLELRGRHLSEDTYERLIESVRLQR